jgi:O-antigen/teichoic acid export membrane protein
MAQIHKNISFAGVGQFLYTIMAFILFPFATRYLGKEGYGLYSLAATLGFFVSLVTDLGLTTLMTREISKRKNFAGRIFAYSLGLKTLLVPFTFLLLGVYFILARTPSHAMWVIVIFTLSAILGSFVQSAYAIFRGFERMQYETVGVFLEKFIIVSLGITFLILRFDIIVFISVFLIAAIIKLVLSLWFLEKYFIPLRFIFRRKRCTVLLKAAFPFGISIFLAMCYNYIGILLLSIMTGYNEVGLYSASFRLLTFTTLIPTVLTTAFLPQLSFHHQNRARLSDLFLKGCRYLLIFAVPMIPFVIFQAKSIIGLIAGPGWENAELPLQMLVIAAFAQMFNNFFVPLYAAANRQQKIVHFQLVGLGVNLVLNFFLIRAFSYKGAALATIATEWTIFCLVFWWAHRHIVSIHRKNIQIKFIVGIIFATIFMCVFFESTHFINLDRIMFLLLSMVAYAVGLQLFGCVNYFMLMKAGINFIQGRTRKNRIVS